MTTRQSQQPMADMVAASNSAATNTTAPTTTPTRRGQPKPRLVPREQYPPGKESELFSHLELGYASIESLISFNERAQDVGKDVQITNITTLDSTEQVLHTAFVQLGMDYATGQIIGTYRRCISFLEALSAFLGDMKPSDETLLSTRLINYINAVVQYLGDCRAVPLPFDNIISKCQDIIDQTTRQYDSQKKCIEKIRDEVDAYRFELQSQHDATHETCSNHLKDGDVILTFGHSESVIDALLKAQDDGKVIKVIVVDAKPLLEGKKTLHKLTNNRFECEYALITSLQYIMPQVSKVLLGAHAVLSNGALLARSGTALTALCAKRCNKPVLVCCESFKFVKQAYIDSICHNELANPTNILLNSVQQKQAQESVFSTPLKATTTAVEEGVEPINQTRLSLHSATMGTQNEHVLTNWLKIPNLKLLSLRFDLTPANYISALITDDDTIPPSSASVVVRESLRKSKKNNEKQSA